MSYARAGLLSRFGLRFIPGHSGNVIVGLQRIGGAMGFSFGSIMTITTGCVLDQHSLSVDLTCKHGWNSLEESSSAEGI